MNEDKKLPLKRVELSLSKFNEVAIPHHLDLLRQHKANIIKLEASGSYPSVRREQTHARRVAAQLKSLLAELDALRKQVKEDDLEKFDKMTQKSRDLTLKAIMDYLDVIESGCQTLAAKARRCETSPLSINRVQSRPSSEREVSCSAVSTDSVGVVRLTEGEHEGQGEQIQLQINEEEVALAEREAVLSGWTSLQSEVHSLHETWRTLHEAAMTQREGTARVAESVDVAAENIEVGTAHLATAARIRAGALGMSGAALGALVGGPLGLLLGAKVGAAAALLGGGAGYFAARALRPAITPSITEASTEKEKED